jgi:hypothetical protein
MTDQQLQEAAEKKYPYPKCLPADRAEMNLRTDELRAAYIQGRKDEREAQQWIPVTQEPERGGWFIVRDPNSPFRNKVQIARYSKCNNMWFEDHNSDDSLHPDYYVHILPEPPVKEP